MLGVRETYVRPDKPAERPVMERVRKTSCCAVNWSDVMALLIVRERVVEIEAEKGIGRGCCDRETVGVPVGFVMMSCEGGGDVASGIESWAWRIGRGCIAGAGAATSSVAFAGRGDGVESSVGDIPACERRPESS